MGCESQDHLLGPWLWIIPWTLTLAQLRRPTMCNNHGAFSRKRSMQNRSLGQRWVKVNKQLKQGRQGFMSVPAGVYEFPDRDD